MRKPSARAKALNEIAKANAHAAQVMRLNEGLQVRNAELIADICKLQKDMSGAAQVHANQAASIASFKQEALQSETTIAELRGYIARVLEDDTVREVGGAKAEAAVLPDEERSHMQQMLHADSHSRRHPPRSVRRGPGAMHPMAINGGDCFIDSNDRPYRVLDRNAPSATNPMGRHWLDR